MPKRNKRKPRRGGLRPQDSTLSRSTLQRKQRSIKRERGQDNFTATAAVLLDAVRRKATEDAIKRNQELEAQGSKYRIDPQNAADRAEHDLLGGTYRKRQPMPATPLKQEAPTLDRDTVLAPYRNNPAADGSPLEGQYRQWADSSEATRKEGRQTVSAMRTANRTLGESIERQERERKAQQDKAKRQDASYQESEKAAQAELDKHTDYVEPPEHETDLSPMRRSLAYTPTILDENAHHLYQRSVNAGSPMDGLALARAVHDRRPAREKAPHTARRATHLQRKAQRQVRANAKSQDERSARHVA